MLRWSQAASIPAARPAPRPRLGPSLRGGTKVLFRASWAARRRVCHKPIVLRTPRFGSETSGHRSAIGTHSHAELRTFHRTGPLGPRNAREEQLAVLTAAPASALVGRSRAGGQRHGQRSLALGRKLGTEERGPPRSAWKWVAELQAQTRARLGSGPLRERMDDAGLRPASLKASGVRLRVSVVLRWRRR